MSQSLVVFSSGAAAVELWAFGEDDLSARMLCIVDDVLLNLWKTAAVFYGETYPLPVVGRRITGGHVIAFACMFHLEGDLRPLARQRRRARSAVPEHLALAKRAKDAELSGLQMRLVHSK